MTRKIDKRACRKLAMPELEFNLNEGVLHVDGCPYIIRTAVRNIAGQRILMLYIYQREHSGGQYQAPLGRFPRPV